MKKRAIVVLVLLSTILAGTAYAAVNGYFSGYPIVNVKVNGQEVKGDTPAINFNGRTMVPLAFVGNALGANVTWDAATETAVVSSGGQTIPNADLLKAYNKVGDFYIRLYLLTDHINLMYDGLNIASNGILAGIPEVAIHLSNMRGTYTDINKEYIYRFTEAAEAIRTTQNVGMSAADINLILAKQKEAITYSKQALDALDRFYYTDSPVDFQDYLFAQAKLKALCVETSGMALDGYRDFYLLIQSN